MPTSSSFPSRSLCTFLDVICRAFLLLASLLTHYFLLFGSIRVGWLVGWFGGGYSNKNYGAVRPSCHPSSLGNDDPKLAQRASPVLTQFRWLRMVLDEAHELPMGIGRKGKTGIDDIADIQATFRSPSST
jgi:hypothetical protein